MGRSPKLFLLSSDSAGDIVVPLRLVGRKMIQQMSFDTSNDLISR